jgi:pimeloyl-ACP methyl ester carboxylesterase
MQIKVNGVELCVETFGDPADPPVLLIGVTMLSWPDGLCAALAGRYVVRYDLRDAGQSTFVDPDAPTYGLRDLVTDASELLVALDLGRTHVVGMGVGGFIAQLLALDHPDQVASLTLVSTRPVAPGPVDSDLPDHAPEVMAQLFGVRSRTGRSRQRGRLHDRFRAADVRVAGIRRAGRAGGCRVGLRPSRTNGEGAAGEPPRQHVRGHRLPATLARAARRDHRPDPGAARRRGSVLPARQRSGAGRGDPGRHADHTARHRPGRTARDVACRCGRPVAPHLLTHRSGPTTEQAKLNRDSPLEELPQPNPRRNLFMSGVTVVSANLVWPAQIRPSSVRRRPGWLRPDIVDAVVDSANRASES